MNTEVQRDTAIRNLREIVTRESTIYVILRRRDELGTCRWVELYNIYNGELKRLTWDVGLAIQAEYCREHDALKITGSGLDVGFASVSDLSYVLFDTSYALKHQWL